ncbi:hypothetical protein CEQ90_01600 [Lewinellaceae bacterium SD302]|nr:hypothetical protein CEQ90_01600 [Lewinellaceae bacterium SD302]
MPKQKTDDLLRLIDSLTRAEKRHFRLFVKRNQAAKGEILFLELFNYLEKQDEYDEEHLMKRIKGIKKSQLSNQKAHLYKQLLTSLRLLNRNKDEEIMLRENIDYARILYNKGLYSQSLDILGKVKKRALTHEFHTVALEVAQFEKLIEGQYVTRSIRNRSTELSEECSALVSHIAATERFSNLSLRLYSYYLAEGMVKNEAEQLKVKAMFDELLPAEDFEELNFWGQVYYCQSYMGLHHICQEFPMVYRYSQRVIDMFRDKPNMIQLNAALYLRGLHTHLANLFNMWQYDKFKPELDILLAFPETYDLSTDANTESLWQLYSFTHRIQLHFIRGTFSEGLELVPPLMEAIEEDTYNWDEYRHMLFYYRIACLYFGSGDNNRAIDYLNLIINQRSPNYRSDIQAYARILSLICHFEMGNVQLVEYQVKSVYRFLAKVEHLQETQQHIFKFLRRLPRIQEAELKEEFIQLKEQLDGVSDRPFEQRTFTYLDVASWLKSKIEDKSVQQVIREQFEADQARG